jgi:hypothetical protein
MGPAFLESAGQAGRLGVIRAMAKHGFDPTRAPVPKCREAASTDLPGIAVDPSWPADADISGRGSGWDE